MQKTISRIVIAGLVLAVFVTMGSCEWFVEEVLLSAGGYIVDARGNTGDLSGFTVTLESTTGTYSKTATTNTNGYYSFSDVESGTFTVSATKDGWFAPPAQVTVGGLADSFPDLPAFSLSVDDLWGISFIATWNNTEGGSADDDIDVDIHMSFSSAWTSQGGATSFIDPYDTYPSLGRDRVNFIATEYPVASSDPAVRIDNDTTPYTTPYGASNPQLPETITLRYATTNIGDDGSGTPMTMASTQATDTSGLRAAFNDDLQKIDTADRPTGWRWIGQAEVYLNAFNYDGSSSAALASNNGAGAGARLYVIQTIPSDTAYSEAYKGTIDLTVSDLDYVYLGSYTVPEYTNVASAAMVRVNMLVDDADYEWYQIVPDIRVIPEGPSVDEGAASDVTFLSVDGSVPYISGVRGRRRQ